jgi:hypothetical protein
MDRHDFKFIVRYLGCVKFPNACGLALHFEYYGRWVSEALGRNEVLNCLNI